MMASKPDDTPSVASGAVTVDVNSKSPAAEPERKACWRSRPCLAITALAATIAIIVAVPVAIVTAMNTSNSAANPSTSSPAPDSLPPNAPGRTIDPRGGSNHSVKYELTFAGDMTDFNQTIFIDDLVEYLELDSPDDVSLELAAGSVNVAATINAGPNASKAYLLDLELRTSFGNPADATEAFGHTVLNVNSAHTLNLTTMTDTLDMLADLNLINETDYTASNTTDNEGDDVPEGWAATPADVYAHANVSSVEELMEMYRGLAAENEDFEDAVLEGEDADDFADEPDCELDSSEACLANGSATFFSETAALTDPSGAGGFCSWTACSGIATGDGGEFCDASQANCEGECAGTWCAKVTLESASANLNADGEVWDLPFAKPWWYGVTPFPPPPPFPPPNAPPSSPPPPPPPPASAAAVRAAAAAAGDELPRRLRQ